MIPNVIQKVATAVFTWRRCFSKYPKKSPNIWATFVKKISQDLSKTAQSGHTSHSPPTITRGPWDVQIHGSDQKMNRTAKIRKKLFAIFCFVFDSILLLRDPSDARVAIAVPSYFSAEMWRRYCKPLDTYLVRRYLMQQFCAQYLQ